MSAKSVVAILAAACAVGAGASAASRPPTCTIGRLRLALGPHVSEATGQHTLALRLVNRGSTCSLDGYPALWLEDQSGRVPFVIRRGGDQMVNSRRPAPVRLRLGGAAIVALNHYRCDRGPVRSATVVRLGLPGTSRAASLALAVTDPYLRPAWCGPGDPGSIVSVSPFEPTLRAALRRS
jgi:hypothetical protein